MEAWLAKAIVMILLACVVFVCGLIPIKLFRSIGQRSVNIRQSLSFIFSNKNIYTVSRKRLKFIR